jgi:hypothetical protein
MLEYWESDEMQEIRRSIFKWNLKILIMNYQKNILHKLP